MSDSDHPPDDSPLASRPGGARGRRGDLEEEPLSIAEEIAQEVRSGEVEPKDRYEALKQGDTHLTNLQRPRVCCW